MIIKEIVNKDEKKNITRKILEQLQDWFAIEESREKYIEDSANQIFFVAQLDDKDVGFIAIKETGKYTVEIAVMGILKEFHRKGVGRKLFESVKVSVVEKGYSFIQVKTVQMGKYEVYDRTNKFYISLGFKEFEVFPTLWDEANPCQIYIMHL